MKTMSAICRRAAQSVTSATMPLKTSCEKSTRSILLTATTRCGVRSSEEMYA